MLGISSLSAATRSAGLAAEGDGERWKIDFDRYRVPLYKEAKFKPYIIGAMIFLGPQATLKALVERGAARWFQK